MTLHWGAAHIRTCIPEEMISNMVPSISCDPFFTGTVDGLPIYNSATGELLLTMNGVEPRRVSRRVLLSPFVW